MIEVESAAEPLKLPDSAARYTDVYGEALVVRLAQDFIVMTLTVGGPAGTLPVAIVKAFFGSVSDPDDFGAKLDQLASSAMIGRSANIAREDFPVFVRFADPADPASASTVDPDGFRGRDGRSMFVSRVSCEVTRKPTSQQIKQYVTCLEKIGDSSIIPDNDSIYITDPFINKYSFLRTK